MIASAATPTANPNLATLLFYTCVTKEVKNQCNESFTLDQAESANAGFTANFTTIEQGHRVGISSLFATHDIFFENGKGMRPDWEARWADASKKLAPLIKARKVVDYVRLRCGSIRGCLWGERWWVMRPLRRQLPALLWHGAVQCSS